MFRFKPSRITFGRYYSLQVTIKTNLLAELVDIIHFEVLLVVIQIPGHMGGSLRPSPLRTVRALHFYREKIIRAKRFSNCYIQEKKNWPFVCVYVWMFG